MANTPNSKFRENIKTLFLNLQIEKGQDPLNKKNSHENKLIHARDSLKCTKDTESWQKISRDKIKSPQPNKTKTSNFEQFQKTPKLVLKAQMPTTKMIPTPRK